MKTGIGLIGLILTITLTPIAPARGELVGVNTNAPVPELTLGASLDSVLSAITTATNWTVAPFMTVVRDNESDRTLYGAGVAGIFNLTSKAATMIRVEELEGDFYMVSANLQLQFPFDAFQGNARITPFGFFGAALPWGGHVRDGLIGIAGAGWDVSFPKVSSHWSVAFDLEYWSDRPGVQWRISPLVWKF
jgi:hypothetical protein